MLGHMYALWGWDWSMALIKSSTGNVTIIPAFCWCMGLTELNWTELNWTTLLVFKRFFSSLDIFVVVSAIVRAAPIVGAAVLDEYSRLGWTNFLFTSSTSFNQQKLFFKIVLTICSLFPTISIPGLQWHMLAALSKCRYREHTKHIGRERQFESFERSPIDAVFLSY